MVKLAGISRAALLGTLCAMVAFSYAIATVDSASVVESVDSRGVGTSALKFTNAKAANGDRDLGDVVLGGSFTRFARAAGGLPPYKFSSPTEFGIARLVGTTLQSGAVDFSGKVSGVVGTIVGGTFGAGPLDFPLIRFNVNVVDQAVGTTGVTEVFQLNVDQTGVFKFAIGSDLGSATRFADFATQIETINGKGNITYTVGTVALSGNSAVNSLDDVGLFIDTQGKVFGKPFLAGTLSFQLTARDSTGATAAPRTGSGTSQTFSLLIEDSTNITSDVVVQKVSIKYNTAAKKPSDSVTISGLLNVKGGTVASFNGKTFVTQIGNFVSQSVMLDAKGKSDKTQMSGTEVVSKTNKVSVTAKGTFKASYTKKTIASNFLTGTSFPTGVTLSGSVTGSDPLDYTRKEKDATVKSTITYAIGKNTAKAGGFILTSVKGTNNKEGNGTKFTANYIALPGSLAVTSTASIDVSVGNVTDNLPGAVVKGSKISAKQKTKDNDAVTSATVDSLKGKGSSKTNAILAASSGIAVAPTNGQFPFAVALKSATATLFTGQGSIALIGKNKSFGTVAK